MSGREVIVLALADIRVPEGRFRSLKASQAAAIGASIAAEGQFDPIAVTRLPGQTDYVLVDGWHRLEGSRIAGLPTIEARLIEPGKSARVKREVLSGLVRATEDVFDRAAAIDALKRIARDEAGLPEVGDLRQLPVRERRGAKAISEEADGHLDIMSKWLRWDEQLAEQLGCDARSVRRLAIVHERIHPAEKAALRRLGQADKLVPLTQFAVLEEAQQLAVLRLLDSGTCADLAAAIASLEERPALTAAEKAQNALFRKAGTWSPRERASFWAQWTAAYHPDGRPKSQSGRTKG